VVDDPYWSIEGFGGLSPRSEKDVFLGGLGFVLRLSPGSVIGPYVNIGVGAAHIRPRPTTSRRRGDADGPRRRWRPRDHVQEAITVRLDARNWTLFDENHSNNGQEYSGGLAIFF